MQFQRVCHDTLPGLISFSLGLMRLLTISVVLAAISMIAVSSTRGFSVMYYTTIRNDTDAQIELNPDLKYSRELYVIAPHSSLTFLGGLSTVGFSIHTGARTFQYKFPLWFGAEPTLHRGRQNHSYVFARDHRIYPLSPTSTILHESHDGFPITPLAKGA